MGTVYQRFIKKKIDLSPMGIDFGTENCSYFCTPKGANIIGWTGVDGVHYCFIRGFGEMVFAVSPMDAAGNYVHPVARNFADFLRLLLACGNEAALEQAHAWGQSQFDTFLLDNPITEEQRAVMNVIEERTELKLMESPFTYIKELQAEFDYSRIKYTEDFYDLDMNQNAEPQSPEWKVFFDGNFWGHHGRDHAGKEISINMHFQWADRNWQIPSVYSCSKGLVVEFCMQIDPKRIREFMDKWNLSIENDSCRDFSREQQMEMEMENPLCFEFRPKLFLNGKELVTSHGCGLSYNPCLPEGVINEMETKCVMEHYGLDASYGWMIWRSAFPWKTKQRPEIRTISVTMEQQLISIPGIHFHVSAPGDRIEFIHPTTGLKHTLHVQEYEKQETQKNGFDMMPEQEFPTCYTAMSYTVTPDLPEGAFTIQDCVESDSPRCRQRDSMEPEANSSVACVGIIGGADGPTEIVVGKQGNGKKRAACSALHFEPVEDVEWRMVFHEKQYEELSVELM